MRTRKNNLNNKKNMLKSQVTEVQKCEPTKEAIYFKSLDTSIESDMMDGSSPYTNFYCNGKDSGFLSIVDPYACLEQNLVAASFLLDDSSYNKIYRNINKNRTANIIMMEIDNIYYNGFYNIIKDYISTTSAINSMLIGSLFNLPNLENEIYYELNKIFLTKHYDKLDIKELVSCATNILTSVANSYYDITSSLVYNRGLVLKDDAKTYSRMGIVNYVFFDTKSFFKDHCHEILSNVESSIMTFLLIVARKDIEKIDSLLKINIANAINKLNSLNEEKDMDDLDEDDEWD